MIRIERKNTPKAQLAIADLQKPISLEERIIQIM